jgi:hypothetical protein
MIVPDLSIDSSEITLGEIDSFVTGKVFALPTEVYTNATSLEGYMDKLREDVNTANAAVVPIKQDGQARAELNYKAALYRDSFYALMGRGRLLELGLNNQYSEAYQVGHDASNAATAKLP